MLVVVAEVVVAVDGAFVGSAIGLEAVDGFVGGWTGGCGCCDEV